MWFILQTMFEDVRHERSLTLLLSLTDPDILREINLMDIDLKKKEPCFRKLT